MKLQKRKKRPITLLEIMIVIFLIGLIGSVVGYNVKGSLEEGKAFRSEQGAAQIRDVLLLEVAKGHPIEKVIEHKEEFLKTSGLIKDPGKILNDGWGLPYKVIANRYGTDIIVKSDRLTEYKKKKNAALDKADQVDEELDEEDPS